jgi:DNA modification methylase
MELKNFADLKADPKNPRKLSEHDGKALKNSLDSFGDLSCIVFNVQTQQLVGGHQRLAIMEKLPGEQRILINERAEPEGAFLDDTGTVAIGYVFIGNKQFAYREVDWDYGRQHAANIAANRIQGEWDLDLLAEVNYELSLLDNGADLLALTGQTDLEISSSLDSVGALGDPAEDEAPEVDEVNPPVSKLGEIYQLGKHRLMCGDSTDLGQISDLLNGAKVGVVFTDPPYNAAFSGRSGNHEVIMNDEMKPEDFERFINQFMETLYLVAQGAPKYICTDWKMYPLIYRLMESPSACIVWVKNMFGMGNGYRHQHELIVFEGSLEASDQSDVWEIKRDNGADYARPTQKPVALPEKALRNSSLRGDVILDVFAGSGPVLIAAEKLDRLAYLMELDPKYCDVIRKRYHKHVTGSDEGWQEATPVVET